MPRLHSSHYEGLRARDKVDVAILGLDGEVLDTLLRQHPRLGPKDGARHLFGLADVNHRALLTDYHHVQDGKLHHSKMNYLEPPPAPSSLEAEALGMADRLMAAGANPFAKLVSDNERRALSDTITADYIFSDAMIGDCAPVKGRIILHTLNGRPGYRPALRAMYQNVLSSNQMEELRKRNQLSEHIAGIGRYVEARLLQPQDELERAVIGKMSDLDKKFWLRGAAAWHLDPTKQPHPDQEVRSEFNEQQNLGVQRFNEGLRQEGLLSPKKGPGGRDRPKPSKDDGPKKK